MDTTSSTAAAGAAAAARQHGDSTSSSSAPALALKKKPKKRVSDHGTSSSSSARKERDESEFVSVEVGMREFQRRLAGRSSITNSTPTAPKSSTSEQTMVSSAPQPLPLAKSVRATKAAPSATPRARATPAAAARASTPTPRKRASPAATPTTTAKAPAAPRAKKATPSPTTKAGGAGRSRKPTLADIRAELLREQQQRIESRIQTLQCANCSSLTPADNAHGHSSSPARAPSSATPATGDQPMAPPPPPQHHHHAPPPAPAAHAPVPITLAPRSAAAATTTVPPPPAAAQSPPPSAIKNEFIDDDVDEDMAFMMALEHVERTLVTPTKAPLVHATALHASAPAAVQIKHEPSPHPVDPIIKCEPLHALQSHLQPSPSPAAPLHPHAAMAPATTVAQAARPQEAPSLFAVKREPQDRSLVRRRSCCCCCE